MERISRLSDRARRGLRFRRHSWADGHTAWFQWLRTRPVMARSKKVAIPALGAVLIWSSLGFVGYAAGWTIHKHRADSLLVAQMKTPASPVVPTSSASPAGECIQASPQTGQLTGVLDIPALGLTAPVEQGTDDAVLAVATGHAAQSVLPGANGTSVLLAHDVSYFVHLGTVKTGDLVIYRNQCRTLSFQVTGEQVVTAGAPVSNSTTPTMVLDTCWPTNALFYTSQRLLVTAVEVPNSPTSAPSANSTYPTRARPQALMNPVRVPTITNVTFTTPAPAALVAQGLSLTQNEAPMGTMVLTGDTTTAFEQSPEPLGLVATALEAYFGGIHASEQNRPDWWSAIAPNAVMPRVLQGASITGHDSPLNVAINSVQGAPSTVTLTTTITVSGGYAPGVYDQTVTLGVAGAVVTIQTWGLSHG